MDSLNDLATQFKLVAGHQYVQSNLLKDSTGERAKQLTTKDQPTLHEYYNNLEISH